MLISEKCTVCSPRLNKYPDRRFTALSIMLPIFGVMLQIGIISGFTGPGPFPF